MKTSCNEADYEPLRAWALLPSLVRPPEMAQILQGGLITWLQVAQSLPTAQSVELPGAQTTHAHTTPPLSTLVAAMIAEVSA